MVKQTALLKWFCYKILIITPKLGYESLDWQSHLLYTIFVRLYVDIDTCTSNVILCEKHIKIGFMKSQHVRINNKNNNV